MLRADLLLEPDRFADDYALVDRRETADLGQQAKINPQDLSFCVDLGGMNSVPEFRKEDIHLDQGPSWRRGIRTHINTAAPNVPAPAVSALQSPVLITPGEDNGKPQAEALASASFPHMFRFPHHHSLTTGAPIRHNRAPRERLYAHVQICKDDDSGLRRRTSPFCFCTPFVDGTVFSEF